MYEHTLSHFDASFGLRCERLDVGIQCKASAASETQPAKLLAEFVVDTYEKELVIPFGN